jgi:hypothetical protein
MSKSFKPPWWNLLGGSASVPATNPIGKISESGTAARSLAEAELAKKALASSPFDGSYLGGWTMSTGVPIAKISDAVRDCKMVPNVVENTFAVQVKFADGSVYRRDFPVPARAPAASEEKLQSQRESLDTLWEFIEEQGLMSEAIAWCYARGVSTSN